MTRQSRHRKSIAGHGMVPVHVAGNDQINVLSRALERVLDEEGKSRNRDTLLATGHL